MVVLGLFVKAEFENISELLVSDEAIWQFDVKNSAGEEEKRERITLQSDVEFPIPNSRGTANFLVRWQDARQPSTIKIVKTPVTKNSISVEGGEEGARMDFVPVLALDCRGVEPYLCAGFSAKSSKGKLFEEIDLSEREWVDYDEEHSLSVGIFNL